MTARPSSPICRSVADASNLLKAIANPNRLSIVCMLLEGERSVAQLEAGLGIRQPTLSQQLTELRAAGVIQGRRRARHVTYRLVDARAARIVLTLRAVFDDLEHWCAGLGPQGRPVATGAPLTMLD